MELESTTSGVTSRRSNQLSYGHSADGGARTHNGPGFEPGYCTNSQTSAIIPGMVPGLLTSTTIRFSKYRREGWDLNPRSPFEDVCFRNRCLKPLGHLPRFSTHGAGGCRTPN